MPRVPAPTARRLVAALAVALAAAALPAAASVRSAAPAPAPLAAPRWTPADRAPIHPGVQVVTGGNQCTSNFIFYETATGPDRVQDVYLGMAAHCAGTGAATDTDGCLADSLPLGTPVQIAGATRPGVLAYSSWTTMQRIRERRDGPCLGNDVALVRIDRSDLRRVNPSIPVLGGPTGLDRDGTRLGDTVLTYGDSSLRLGASALRPKQGTAVGTELAGWSHVVYTATPGIPGDSGSAFLDDRGRALGVLSTVALLPLPASNAVSDLRLALAYLQQHTPLRVALATGTTRYAGPLL